MREFGPPLNGVAATKHDSRGTIVLFIIMPDSGNIEIFAAVSFIIEASILSILHLVIRNFDFSTLATTDDLSSGITGAVPGSLKYSFVRSGLLRS